MADVIFRSATRGDLPAIVALLADDVLGQTRETNADTLDAAYLVAFERILANPNDDLVVADLAGRVVGCLQLTFLSGLSMRGTWRGQVESVRVASDLRGAGIGRSMMLWVIEACRAKGCGLLQLTTNTARIDAQRFYVSLGFKASHVGMKLDLAGSTTG
ncbi:GNAT family N-acetyltransferase [Acidisphaera sp. L21]|uniref:GNAT family N-acetyltransferase n=1 Tax=Acidisphaera sp. L21 TaxID=1641851 RepID=UPI00131BFCA1|nr:GNAT family N-acetyltransferase [Acidisphaera sp. L21]